jgi:4-amino-4-deoxy-L-arabinose transferase-like glycosyltransferase
MNQNVNFSNQNRDLLIILGIAAINLGIHLLTNVQYGFHRDELYFIDCSKHLDLGYADMPPLTPFLARLDLGIFGESLRGLRVLPALLSSAMVFLTGLMTRELGGRLYAQVLAVLAIMVAPVYLIAGTQFQTIPVDQFFWVLTSYLLIRVINTSNQKLWLLIGVVLGLGLLAKYSVLFLAFAIFFSLIISHDRFMFTRIWIWLGALIALLVFLPNIIWQIQNGKAYGLPEASSGISSYYYWGPVNPQATTFLFVGYSEGSLTEYFSDVQVMEIISNPYGIDNEEQGQLIILCRRPKLSMSKLWLQLKHY